MRWAAGWGLSWSMTYGRGQMKAQCTVPSSIMLLMVSYPRPLTNSSWMPVLSVRYLASRA